MGNVWLDPFGLKLLKQPEEKKPQEDEKEPDNTNCCKPGYTYGYYGYNVCYVPNYVCLYHQPVQYYPQYYNQYNCNPHQSRCHCNPQTPSIENDNKKEITKEVKKEPKKKTKKEVKERQKAPPTFWNPR